MKLDSNAAWKDAMAAISANREVMGAIAGVFFLLPSLALSLFVPQPEPPAGAGFEEAMKIVSDFYISALPFMIPMLVLQLVGTLAILTLCTDRSRPTVGEAIKQGFVGFLSYLATSLITSLGIGFVASLLIAFAMATKSVAVIALIIVAVVIGAIYLSLRFLLAAPAIVVERLYNPLTALKRSWALTEGNAGRMFLFMLLILVAYLVLTLLIMLIVGGLVALVAGAEAGEVAGAVLSAFLGAGFTVAIAAVLAKIHGQLAGTGAQDIGATFD